MGPIVSRSNSPVRILRRTNEQRTYLEIPNLRDVQSRAFACVRSVVQEIPTRTNASCPAADNCPFGSRVTVCNSLPTGICNPQSLPSFRLQEYDRFALLRQHGTDYFRSLHILFSDFLLLCERWCTCILKDIIFRRDMRMFIAERDKN